MRNNLQLPILKVDCTIDFDFESTALKNNEIAQKYNITIRLAELAWQKAPTYPATLLIVKEIVSKAYEEPVFSNTLFYKNKLDHHNSVATTEFSSDREKIVTASRDTTARIWLTPEGIIDWLASTKSVYRLTSKDMEELGIDFIDIDK